MKVAGLSGLVIDRRVEEFSPCRELSTIRLSQDSPPHASVDIVVRDPDGRFPLGKRLDVSLEDASDGSPDACRNSACRDGQVWLGSQPYGSPGESYMPCPDCNSRP